MKDNEYKVAGFSFFDAHEFKEAKREEESIEYIKANTDINDLNKALKLYHKLAERKTLKTVVGIAFMKELQERIIKEGIVNRDNLPTIQIEKKDKTAREFTTELGREREKKHLEIVEDFKIKLRNSRIISTFLLIIIITMVLISIFSDRNIFTKFENSIIDNYSTWKEELETREAALDAREAQLNEREKANIVD